MKGDILCRHDARADPHPLRNGSAASRVCGSSSAAVIGVHARLIENFLQAYQGIARGITGHLPCSVGPRLARWRWAAKAGSDRITTYGFLQDLSLVTCARSRVEYVDPDAEARRS